VEAGIERAVGGSYLTDAVAGDRDASTLQVQHENDDWRRLFEGYGASAEALRMEEAIVTTSFQRLRSKKASIVR